MVSTKKDLIYKIVVISLFLVYISAITIIWGDNKVDNTENSNSYQQVTVIDSEAHVKTVSEVEETIDQAPNSTPNTITQQQNLIPISNTDSISHTESLDPLSTSLNEFPAIDSYRYEISEPGTYYIDLPEYAFSAMSLKWEAGVLYLGDTIQSLDIVDVSDEGGSEILNYSELIYGYSSSVIISIDEPTTLNLYIYKPTVSKVDAESISNTASFENSDSGAKYSKLNIISRDVWGADPSSWDYSSLDIDDPARLSWGVGYFRADRFVIHHTASPNTADDPARAVRDIYRYHAYTRGWGDTGYNYLIDQWGNIYEGKNGGEEVFGYHANQEANAMSIGIAMIGDFTQYYPTSAAMNSLAKLIAEKSVLFDFGLKMSDSSLSSWLDKSYTVFGHHDTYFWCTPAHPKGYQCPTSNEWSKNFTACPGNYLESQFPSILSTAQTAAQYSNIELANAVNKVNSILENAPADIEEFAVRYNLSSEVSEETIRSKIPEFSGISDVKIEGNIAKIYVDDWYGTEIVPPIGWDGYYSNTFFPASGGPKDRIRTLMKVFMMDPDVKDVGLIQQYSISPIE